MTDEEQSSRIPGDLIQPEDVDFSRAFEDRFRGSRELVSSRLRAYLPFIEPLKSIDSHPAAVDLGCGRGEWLELLADNGFDAQGVDLDDGILSACHERGLRADKADAVAFLKRLPSESQTVVSGFHIAEHLPFPKLRILVQEAVRVLKPAGLLILETPNPENFCVASLSFYCDPTHLHPLPPELLSFLAEHYGFARVKIVRLQESSDLLNSQTVSLGQVLGGASPDYAVVAQKAAAEAITKSCNNAFDREFGIAASILIERFDLELLARNERLRTQNERLEGLDHRLDEERDARVALEARLDDERDVRLALETRLDDERNVRVALEARLDDERDVRLALEARLDDERNVRVALEARLDDERNVRAELEKRYPVFTARKSLGSKASLRSAHRAARWFLHGCWAWLTLKPGTRPSRLARRGAALVERFVFAWPRLGRPAKNLRRFPALQGRLRTIHTAEIRPELPRRARCVYAQLKATIIKCNQGR